MLITQSTYGANSGFRIPVMSFEHRRDGFTLSTDPGRLDLDAIHAFLSTSYWAEGIPREILERALRTSLCFGLYAERAQGSARSASPG